MDPPPSHPTASSMPMAPPAGRVGRPGEVQQEPSSGPGDLPIEAASNKPSRAIAIPQPQYREPLYQRREKDIIPFQLGQRTDSIDSYTTSFRNRRTNTGWSIAASTITDLTEPSSPDGEQATFHDEPMLFEDSYASSPRPLGHSGRSVTFQTGSPGPSRSSSIAIVDPNKPRNLKRSSSPDNTPVPKHTGIRRLQDRSSSPRGGIFRRSSSINSASTGPGLIGPSRSKFARRPTFDDSEDRIDSPDLPEDRDVKAEDDTTPSKMLREVVESIPEETDQSSVKDHATPCEDVHEEAHMTDASDSTGEDIDTPSSTSSKPDDKLVQDVCGQILKHVHGVELQDLAQTGAASAAYNSVSYCLDELSHIVPATSSGSSMVMVLPIREVPTSAGNAALGNNPQIQPGSSGAHYSGFQQGIGGNGGSGPSKRSGDDKDRGSQKRSGDNNGPGGSGGGGGGKRPKVAAVEPVEDHKLSCPFRKRNPVKFNVREHQSCAVQSFPDISQLKRHVKNFHKQKSVSAFACPRCKQDMTTKEGLDNHLAVPNDQICTSQESPASHNPEDGITGRIEDVLNGRKANTKVDTWEVLWTTLFPEDHVRDIPKPDFVPPVELDEVYVRFDSPLFRQELKTRISAEETERDAGQSSHQELEEHINRVVNTCVEYAKHFIDLCRIPSENASCRPRRNRSGNSHGPRSATGVPSPIDQPAPTSVSHLGVPQLSAQPRAIPSKKSQPQRLSVSEGSLSSSVTSDRSWNHVDPDMLQTQQDLGGHFEAGGLSMYSGGQAINAEGVTGDMDDNLTLSVVTTGGGAAMTQTHLTSPASDHSGVVVPPAQVYLRGGNFQVSGSQQAQQIAATHPMMAHQHQQAELHHNRIPSAESVDSGIAFDATTRTYMRPVPAYQTQANMHMYQPGFFQGIQPGGGNPGYFQPMQQTPKLPFNMKVMQGPPAVTMPGGTIDPRTLQHNFSEPNFSPVSDNNSNNGGGIW
ncbi:hypothetical protein B0H66DRAFT_535412 [Apodospora peruviana]|uniref:C2H2-type domain-containing protein n=1 Tax=Apodospora peruviana TaxID=516989 RepID=A0AAE0HX39_9PEZI|nr:hypothetical protein B0H66DRAFT_535412 [Apodospora peruviana]